MKVKCINNIKIESLLTMGKTYDVIKEDEYKYLIIDDDGDSCYYYKEWFEHAISEMRNETINKLLEE